MISQFNSQSEHRKGIIAVAIAALLWSTGGIFIKLVSGSSFLIAFYRSIFTLAIFLILFKQKNFVFNRKSFFAGISYSGILILFVTATKLTTAANAIFLQYTAPIYVLILEPILLKTKLRKINVVTIAACFFGMSLFFFGKISAGSMNGNLVALASGVALASFLLLMRNNSEEHQLPSIFLGNVCIVVLCSFSVVNSTLPTLEEFAMLAFLGIFQIGIAYAVFTYGLQRVEAVEASLIAMIEPVLNPVWVFIWYGEQPSVYAIAGGIIILIAIGLRSMYLEGKKRSTAQ